MVNSVAGDKLMNGSSENFPAGLNESSTTSGNDAAAGSVSLTRDGSKDSMKLEDNQQSPFSGSSPLSDLQAFIAPTTVDGSACPYCSKNFRKPRVLDCLHSMCEDCVIALLDGREQIGARQEAAGSEFAGLLVPEPRPTPPGVIRCPACSQETHVGNDLRFVNAMLLDYVRIREMECAANNPGERVCGTCKSEQPAVANCLHCCSDLCESCVKAHREMKMFDGHKVAIFFELDPEAVPARKKEISLVDIALCNQHQASFVAFCMGCDEPICQHCASEHREHRLAALDQKLGEFFQLKIKELMEHVKAKGNAAAKAKIAIPTRRDELMRSSERCREKIDTTFQIYASILEKVKKHAHAEVDKKLEEQKANMSSLNTAIDAQLAKMNDATRFVTRLVDKGTDAEICTSKRKVWQQLQLIHHSMPDLNTEIELDFDVLTPEDFQIRLEALVGTVQCRAQSYALKNSPKAGFLQSQQTTAPSPITNSTKSSPPSLFLGSLSQLSLGQGSESRDSAAPTPTGGSLGAIGMERRQNRQSNSDIRAMVARDSRDNGGPYASAFQYPLSGGSGEQPSLGSVTNSCAMLNVGRMDGNILAGSQHRSAVGAGRPDLLFNSTMDAANAYAGALPYKSSGMWGAAPSAYGQQLGYARATFDGGSRIGEPKLSSSIGTPLDMSLRYVFGPTGVDCLNTPQGITLGLDDEICIADTNNHRCVVTSPSGKVLRQIGNSGTEEGSLYYPKKVVSLVCGHECRYIVLDKGNTQAYIRLQLFDNDGVFIARLQVPCQMEVISVMAVSKENDMLVVIDNKSNVISFAVDSLPQMRAVQLFNVTGYVHEASDIVINKGKYYITDYKTHHIACYSPDGIFLSKFGGSTITPYPIGIDISKSGDILVGDSHGNHYHVTVFNADGQPLQDHKCLSHKVSRCTGLKISVEGNIVTLSRQNNAVLVFNTLFLPTT